MLQKSCVEFCNIKSIKTCIPDRLETVSTHSEDFWYRIFQVFAQDPVPVLACYLLSDPSARGFLPQPPVRFLLYLRRQMELDKVS